jgi:RsiW-degrading membrane proteinase PrsW (M82 family)
MEFKKLDIKPEGSWVSRTILSQHGKKTILYILVGAIAGFVLFFITQEKQFSEITAGDIVKSMAMGGFFGFFITNSPCARNKC